MMREYLRNKVKGREAALSLVGNPPLFFKGCDAAIVCWKVWNFWNSTYDSYCEWIGGETASISAELVSEIRPTAQVGDVLELDCLKVRLVEYSVLGQFYYVRQVNEQSS